MRADLASRQAWVAGLARVARLAWVAGLALVLGCDLPPPRAELEGVLMATLRAPLDGRLPRDGEIVFAIDGLLEPTSLTSPDARIVSGGRELGVALRFDPVERLLVADPTARALDPDLDYVLRIDGPRDFEGRALEPVSVALRVTRDAMTRAPAPSYDEVLAVLSGCRGCHEGATAALGLDVTDLARTAVGVPALEVQDVVMGPGLRGARRIEPGHPERSYLVYKMLGEGPILGAPMGDADAPDVPLPRASIAIVSRWIAAGARDDRDERP